MASALEKLRDMTESLTAPLSPYSPIEILRRDAERVPRRIEDCWWVHSVHIDFDHTNGIAPADPLHKQFETELRASIQRQMIKGEKHPLPQRPGDASNMIIGFHGGLPPIRAMLADSDRISGEVDPPLILTANEKYFPNEKDIKKSILDKNYTLVVNIDEDIAKMPKREAEKITRMLMARLGAFKVIMVYPNKSKTKAEYYAFGTMEGGLGVEYTNRAGYMDRLRDRLVTQACAKEAGLFEAQENVISKADWNRAPISEYLSAASRQLAEWGYIDKPFDIKSIAGDKRTRLIKFIMNWSRQSESAIATYEPNIVVPGQYCMDKATGVIISSKSGRFNVDKTQLLKMDTIPVAIVPHGNYQPGPNDPLSLYGFGRYALGIEGQTIEEVGGPSIEFDEMSAAILYSGFVRVNRHPSGYGYKLDQHGDIFLPRVRGFVHIHQGIREILSKFFRQDNVPYYLWKTAKDLVEYVPANFKEYPYPVGCGKDIMFAASTDAARRSTAVHYRDDDSGYSLSPGKQVALFDALDHGTNALLLTEPLPNTDWIPDDPFYAFMRIVDKGSGGVKFTDELQMV